MPSVSTCGEGSLGTCARSLRPRPAPPVAACVAPCHVAGLARLRAWRTASSRCARCCGRSWRRWAPPSGALLPAARRLLAIARTAAWQSAVRVQRQAAAESPSLNHPCPHPRPRSACSWQHITDQIGMFCFTGLTPEQAGGAGGWRAGGGGWRTWLGGRALAWAGGRPGAGAWQPPDALFLVLSVSFGLLFNRWTSSPQSTTFI